MIQFLSMYLKTWKFCALKVITLKVSYHTILFYKHVKLELDCKLLGTQIIANNVLVIKIETHKIFNFHNLILKIKCELD